jgi:hypothetical protein
MNAPTPNMLVSSSSTRSSSIETTTYRWIERFNLSKIIIKSEMTSFITFSREDPTLIPT